MPLTTRLWYAARPVIAAALVATSALWFPSVAAATGTPEPSSNPSPPSQLQPSVAFYYGIDPPVELLSGYDAAVVEPDSGFNPLAHRLPHTTWFAYASVGEVLPSRSYYADLPKAWLAGHNESWA